jgi:hypothetical protein
MAEIGDPLDSVSLWLLQHFSVTVFLKISTSSRQDDLTTTGQITKTTKTILSSVSDVDWWTNTLQWVRPLHKPSDQNEAQSTETLERKIEFHCHSFYKTVQEKFAKVNKGQLGMH